MTSVGEDGGTLSGSELEEHFDMIIEAQSIDFWADLYLAVDSKKLSALYLDQV